MITKSIIDQQSYSINYPFVLCDGDDELDTPESRIDQKDNGWWLMAGIGVGIIVVVVMLYERR